MGRGREYVFRGPAFLSSFPSPPGRVLSYVRRVARLRHPTFLSIESVLGLY